MQIFWLVKLFFPKAKFEGGPLDGTEFSVEVGQLVLVSVEAAEVPIRHIYEVNHTTKNLLGDYTTSYLVSNLLIVAFYGLFLWLLSDVFEAFSQSKIFTKKGLNQLSRFYITNLIVPVMFFTLLVVFGQELSDIMRISLLHLVIAKSKSHTIIHLRSDL
jgi:hypothetical protein